MDECEFYLESTEIGECDVIGGMWVCLGVETGRRDGLAGWIRMGTPWDFHAQSTF